MEELVVQLATVLAQRFQAYRTDMETFDDLSFQQCNSSSDLRLNYGGSNSADK